MCVIIVMDKKIPGIDVFKQCEEKNKHGGGISWVENGAVCFKKGIQYKEIYDIATKKGTPCVAHFRISTIGGTPPELCHPFPVSMRTGLALEGRAKSVLFHNGHWDGWKTYCMNMIIYKNIVSPGGPWSDSRALAWIVGHSNDTFLAFTNQKVAIQTARGIIMYGDWQVKDDVSYSNLHWEPQVYFNNEDSRWYDNGWAFGKKKKGKCVGYGEYGGIVYGIDKDGKVLSATAKEAEEATPPIDGFSVMPADMEESTVTDVRTEEEILKGYLQRRLEDERGGKGGK